MSKFAHVAAETRKRVRESPAADEADLNISAISKKSKKAVSVKSPTPVTTEDDLEEKVEDDEDTSASA